ncbi:hypothetical protein [Streptomyces sp. CC208A]|uniref:hypothetical protein n=1 Tax=Streptomyces sp. CC208A TaxID=3044573 RepID=UPI0024A8B2F0|nr:hypothetical protein [Streptomyces sp. CC208A]
MDVNRVLQERYAADASPALTRAMLWDADVRKAGNPGNFIPYVVKDGSAAAWVPGKPGAALDGEFVRRSLQRVWIRPEEYALVLEEVYLDHERQLVTFLGRAEFPDADGSLLRADTSQPLFHVQHGVAGTEERPLNTWRIVLLTEAHDERFLEPFAAMAEDLWLPGFVENYVRDVRGIRLTRRTDV